MDVAGSRDIRKSPEIKVEVGPTLEFLGPTVTFWDPRSVGRDRVLGLYPLDHVCGSGSEWVWNMFLTRPDRRPHEDTLDLDLAVRGRDGRRGRADGP